MELFLFAVSSGSEVDYCKIVKVCHIETKTRPYLILFPCSNRHNFKSKLQSNYKMFIHMKVPFYLRKNKLPQFLLLTGYIQSHSERAMLLMLWKKCMREEQSLSSPGANSAFITLKIKELLGSQPLSLPL